MQIAQVNVPARMIDFGVGQPSPALLPLDLLRKAADHCLSQGPPQLLAYGAERGNGQFLSHLAGFLSDHYGTTVPPDGLFICAGVSQGLDLICTVFTRPGETIFVEEPSYFLALRIFADHGLKVVSIPVDSDGIVIDALEEQLALKTPAFVYTIPTFHNPSSVTLSSPRRQRLVELSRIHGFKIVADEVYHLLDYDAKPPLPLAAYADSGTVLALGSFSKILAPGLRLGWIQADPSLLGPIAGCGLLDSGGGLNPFASAVVGSTIELGLLDAHLTHLKTTYRTRKQALVAALNRHLPDGMGCDEPDGGFFVWIGLPHDIDAKNLLVTAKRHQVAFQPGILFSSQGGLHRYMRLCFAYYDRHDLEEGARRLAKSLAE